MQLLNLHYVAAMRATERLVLLQPEGATINYKDGYLELRRAEKYKE